MNYKCSWSPDGPFNLQVFDARGQLLQDVPDAVPVSEVSSILKKSRRHIYRYIRRGWLNPVATFLGEYFFKREDVESLRSQKRKQPSLPVSMAPLFPEYELKTIHFAKHADLVLSRILERGSRRDVAWAIRHYPLSDRKAFLMNQGARLLSPRALRFWSFLWDVKSVGSKAEWRKPGLAYGGIG